MAHVAVLAISPANLTGWCDHSRPDRSCGSLGNGLPLEGPLALGGELPVDFFDYLFHPSRLCVTAQLCPYASGMNSRGAHTTIPVTFVECDGEEDIRRFRSAGRDERFIRRALKVGVVEVYVRIAVTSRRQIDEPPTITNKRRNPIDQDKVAEVIRPELGFETIGRVAKGRGHNSGVSNNHVERFAFGQQLVGAGTHALKPSKVELDQFEVAATSGSVLAHLCCGVFRFGQIARRPYNVGAVGSQ